MSEINKLIAISKQAGKIILSHYRSVLEVTQKDDNSPVTQADTEANDYIVEELIKHFPDIPVISEESINVQTEADTFFLVDPLDGTKGFISGSGQFTVNIGLIEKGVPTMGVIYIPVSDEIFYTDGKRAFKSGEEIKCRKIPANAVVVVASKSHRTAETDEYISSLKVEKLTSAASSLKFCLLAEGKADIYPRFGRTMEWDTAAGHAILLAAGGSMVTDKGKNFTYNKPDFANGWFIAKGAN